MQNTKTESPVSITISAKSEENVYPNPFEIKVFIKNNNDKPVLLNKRMAIGHKNGISRELYAVIKNKVTGKVAKYFESDINRDFPVLQDYQWIEPGGSIENVFDLNMYYTIEKTGNYYLTVFYESDEKDVNFPEEVQKGTFQSNTLTFSFFK